MISSLYILSFVSTMVQSSNAARLYSDYDGEFTFENIESESWPQSCSAAFVESDIYLADSQIAVTIKMGVTHPGHNHLFFFQDPLGNWYECKPYDIDDSAANIDVNKCRRKSEYCAEINYQIKCGHGIFAEFDESAQRHKLSMFQRFKSWLLGEFELLLLRVCTITKPP
eukprot:288562_1